jgi:site-specific recombinase
MWDWAIWAALVVGALAGIAALLLVAVRAREAWGVFMETRGAVIRGLADFTAQAEAAADKIAAAGETVDVEESLARLRVSLARLAVLTAAIDEAQVTFGRIAAVVPRK